MQSYACASSSKLDGAAAKMQDVPQESMPSIFAM